MVVSVLDKELEYKVDKLKFKTLEIVQPRVKQIWNSNTWINHPGSLQMKFHSHDGGGEGRSLINIFPRNRGAY